MWAIKYRNKNDPLILKAYNYDEIIPLVTKGECFWLKHMSGERYGQITLDEEPSDVMYARWHSVQSKGTIGSGYIKFVRSDNPKDVVLAGQALRENIIERIRLWIKALNDKGKAKSGHDFFSYLAALPDGVLDAEHMFESLRSTIVDNFDAKIKSKRNKKTQQAFLNVKRKAIIQLKECYGIDLTEEEYKLLHPYKKYFDDVTFADEEKNIFAVDLESYSLPEEKPAKQEEDFNKVQNSDKKLQKIVEKKKSE